MKFQIFLLLCPTLIIGSISATQKPSLQQPILRFEIGYLFSSVEGTFHEVALDMQLDLQHPGTCYVNASVATPSIDMKSGMMENFAKDEAFFDVKHFPTMSFSLQQIEQKGNTHLATGVLSIKGVEKSVAIPFQLHALKDGSQLLSGSFTIDRMAYNIGGFMLGLDNKVTIHLSLPISQLEGQKKNQALTSKP